MTDHERVQALGLVYLEHSSENPTRELEEKIMTLINHYDNGARFVSLVNTLVRVIRTMPKPKDSTDSDNIIAAGALMGIISDGFDEWEKIRETQDEF